MPKIAVFPGSFDPFTLGHQDMVLRALPLFDKVIIAIGVNSQKKYMNTLEQREAWINAVFEQHEQVEVRNYQGLTTDFCKSEGASFILRGIRNTIDFEYEQSIGQMNKAIAEDIETVLLLTRPEFGAINASIVRDIVKNGGDASAFVPKEINLHV